jgi:hypothetical protein
MRYLPRVYVPALALMLYCMVGCLGPSQSYQDGVRNAYPVVATRIDGLMPSTPAAANLRAAATAPITFPVASKAWSDAAPVYRSLVTDAPGLDKPAHRRGDWLHTADQLDQLNAAEARHRNIFLYLFTPAPTQIPATQP